MRPRLARTPHGHPLGTRVGMLRVMTARASEQKSSGAPPATAIDGQGNESSGCRAGAQAPACQSPRRTRRREHGIVFVRLFAPFFWEAPRVVYPAMVPQPRSDACPARGWRRGVDRSDGVTGRAASRPAALAALKPRCPPVAIPPRPPRRRHAPRCPWHGVGARWGGRAVDGAGSVDRRAPALSGFRRGGVSNQEASCLHDGVRAASRPVAGTLETRGCSGASTA